MNLFHRCLTKEETKTLFRKLAQVIHPDKGGSDELMILLQEARDERDKFIDCVNTAPYKQSENEKFKYKKKYDDISLGDDALNIIDDLKKYGKKNTKFSLNFVKSVEEFLNKNGHITSGQYNAMVKAYYSYRVDK